MGKKIYTIPQKAAQRAVEDAYESYRIARQDLKREIELELEERLKARYYNVSRKANEAIEAGVTKTDIKLAVRNGNWDSLKKLLSLTEHEFNGTIVESVQFSFSVNPYRHPEFPDLSVVIVRDDTTGQSHEAKFKTGKWYVEHRAVTDPVTYKWDRTNVPLDNAAPDWLEWLYQQDSWKALTKGD